MCTNNLIINKRNCIKINTSLQQQTVNHKSPKKNGRNKRNPLTGKDYIAVTADVIASNLRHRGYLTKKIR